MASVSMHTWQAIHRRRWRASFRASNVWVLGWVLGWVL